MNRRLLVCNPKCIQSSVCISHTKIYLQLFLKCCMWSYRNHVLSFLVYFFQLCVVACNADDVFMETVCETEKYCFSVSALDGKSPDVLCIRLLCTVYTAVSAGLVLLSQSSEWWVSASISAQCCLSLADRAQWRTAWVNAGSFYHKHM